MGMGTCWPSETAATLPSARRRKKNGGGGEGREHIVAVARLQFVIVTNIFERFDSFSVISEIAMD